VLNRCAARTIIARETAASLAEHHPPVLAARIGQRVASADAAQSGRLVAEVDDTSIAAREIAALALEVAGLSTSRLFTLRQRASPSSKAAKSPRVNMDDRKKLSAFPEDSARGGHCHGIDLRGPATPMCGSRASDRARRGSDERHCRSKRARANCVASRVRASPWRAPMG
jgi:hypothetical protein